MREGKEGQWWMLVLIKRRGSKAMVVVGVD